MNTPMARWPTTDPRRMHDVQILDYLDRADMDQKEESKRSKYWIEKETGLPRKAIYETIKMLKKDGLVDEKHGGISRADKRIEYYYITPKGRSMLLCTCALSTLMPTKYHSFKQFFERQQSLESYAGAVRDLLATLAHYAKVKPKQAFSLVAISDEKGIVRSVSSFGALKKTDKNSVMNLLSDLNKENKELFLTMIPAMQKVQSERF